MRRSARFGTGFRAPPFSYAMLILTSIYPQLSHIGYEDVASVLLGLFAAAGSRQEGAELWCHEDSNAVSWGFIKLANVWSECHSKAQAK